MIVGFTTLAMIQCGPFTGYISDGSIVYIPNPFI